MAGFSEISFRSEFVLNTTVRGNKAWRCVWGLCLGLLNAPAFSATPTFSTVFSFDLHTVIAGVVEGTGPNVGTLYGTTADTTLSYGGSIFKAAMTGGAPQVIYQLKETDGYSPQATLLVGTDGYLYGSTVYSPRAGVNTQAGSGTIFKVAQDGSGFTTLHTFAAATQLNSVTGNPENADGMHPNRALIQDSTYLYGVTSSGGLNGSGTVFRVRKSDGVTEVMHHFAATEATGVSTSANIVNGIGEGAFPSSSLTLASDGHLYGVTISGGANPWTTSSGVAGGTGTIYSLDPNSSNTDPHTGFGFQTLYNFKALDDTAAVGSDAIGTNVSGSQPKGTLLEVNGELIGTASDGGAAGFGTVFKFGLTSTPFTTLPLLYSFNGAEDGATPVGDLVLDGSRVYGEATSGSSTSSPVTQFGNLFYVDLNAATYKNDHPLVFAEGSGLTGGLIKASNGDLFGTVQFGNACTANGSGFGAVFRYSVGTGASSSGHANCTSFDSGGGGSMAPGFVGLLAVLGLAPPVRRRLLAIR